MPICVFHFADAVPFNLGFILLFMETGAVKITLIATIRVCPWFLSTEIFPLAQIWQIILIALLFTIKHSLLMLPLL